MLIDDVEKLISDEKIVACNISDLRAVNINRDKDTHKYRFPAKKIEIDGFKNRVTFLYKIDDEHYIEYYSKAVVTVIDNYSLENIQGNKTFPEFEKKYKKNYESSPAVILKRDLLRVGKNEKEAFRQNQFVGTDFSEHLEQEFEKARTRLKEQYETAILEQKKERYASKVFKELEGKRVLVVRISDLQNVALNVKSYDGEFRHGFNIENRSNFQALETTNFILLIRVSTTLYEEYYSKIKILDGNTHALGDFLDPQTANEFDERYNYLLDHPLIASKDLQDYNDDTKHLIGENFDKDMAIKNRIETIRDEAATNLENKYAKIKGIDYDDAYVDNALVDIVLRLKNENTEV